MVKAKKKEDFFGKFKGIGSFTAEDEMKSHEQLLIHGSRMKNRLPKKTVTR